LQAKGRGVIELGTRVGDTVYKIKLLNVLYVPRFEGKLISVKRLIERDELEVNFKSEMCTIIKEGVTIGEANTMSGIYMLYHEKERALKVTQECIHGWHRRLAHRNLDDIKKLQPAIKFKACECTDDCIACIKGKMTRNQFPKHSTNPAKQRLDVVVSDVCGPIQTPSIGKSFYFVTFIDEYTRYSVVKFIKKKSDVFEKIQEFVEMCKNKFGRKPKVIRSDNGGEYVNFNVQSYLKKQGIETQTTVAYSPQQNGIAERKNRTLMEAARAMLEDSKLHQKYWAEAVNTANYIQNRLLGSANVESSPYELWFEKKPELEDMHVFGEEAYAWVPEIKRRKLDNKAIKVKFCGYSEESKGYRVATKEDVIKVVRDIKFLRFKNEHIHVELTKEEKKPIKEELHSNEPLQRVDHSENDSESDINSSEYATAQEDENESAGIEDEEGSSASEKDDAGGEWNATLRRSTRSTKGKKPDYMTFFAAADKNKELDKEPASFNEAVQGPNKEKWMGAMKEELNSIMKNNTYELVELPTGRKAIGSKWVFKIKRDVNGNIVRYKARLVAQGYAQKYGVDYDEVFAPTSKNTTFRMLLSVASARKMSVKHYDIDTAFLHGVIEEGLDIYMKQPPGFEIGNKVCKLNKTIYGLKQAARNWNKAINETLVNAGYRQSAIDKCLYIKGSGENVTYILLYVDDVLVVSKDENNITKIIDVIKSKYNIKDLGDISHFLGMEVKKDMEGNYMINQSSYILKIVEQTGLKDAKDSKLPLEVGYFKNPGGDILEDITEYQSIIGMLLYVSTNTRPDISASVSILSQKLIEPRRGDLGEVKRIIRYLKATKDMQLRLRSSGNQELMGYSDANWAEDRHDRKSNSGYIFKLFGGIISWACRKQSCIALSSTEAEYIALSEACQEFIWLKKLCGEFDINVSLGTKIYVDNQSAAKMSENQKFSNRTKHVDTKYHFIKDLVGSDIIQLEYVCSEDNVADLLTKPLGPTRINYLRNLIQLGN
jgi:transposase InsO family protein